MSDIYEEDASSQYIELKSCSITTLIAYLTLTDKETVTYVSENSYLKSVNYRLPASCTNARRGLESLLSNAFDYIEFDLQQIKMLKLVHGIIIASITVVLEHNKFV